MPLYTETGAINVVSNDTTKGRYSPTGALRINLVSGASYTGLYATDGALNVVDVSGVSISTYGGLYHPCGALRGRTAPDTFSGLQAPDGSYYLRGLFSPLNLFSNGEVGGWYDPSDLTTLFQDAAGTTPVTAVEQPVGLVLDKRSAAFSQSFNGTSNNITIGSMPDALKLGTGDFTIEFFVKTNGTSVYSICGNLNDDSGSGHYWVILNSSYTGLHTVQFSAASTLYKFGTSALSTGAWHHIAITRSGSNLRCFLNGSQLGATGAISDFTGTYNNFVIGSNTTGAGNRYWLNGNLSNLRIVKGSALYTSSFSVPASALTAVSGTVLLCCGNNTFSSNPSLSYNGVVANGSSPFSAIDGSHLSQSTSTARPVLSARVNLLTYTEQFDNAAWAKIGLLAFGSGSTANATTAPDGTLTADLIVEDTTTGEHKCYRSDDLINSTSHTWTVHAKPAGRNWIVINAYSDGNALCWFDVQNGVIGTVASGCTASITAVANGFYRCSVTRTTATTDYYQVYIASGNNSSSYTGNGTSGLYIWGADLRPSNAGVNLPAYQRVGAATDYDTTGFPLYLKFDGTDDFLVSGTINPGSVDKAQVFAGVRKLSDAAISAIVETSTNASSTAGSLVVYSSVGAAGNFAFGLNGSSWGFGQANGFTAPLTNVLAAAFDIGGVSDTDEVAGRINSTAQSLVFSGDPGGTGNFTSQPVYVGSRAGTSLRFNGSLYSLILRFSATNMDAATIASTETWVNSKTGAY